MKTNESSKVNPLATKRQRIYIFDCNVQPKEVDLTSLGQAEITFGRDAGNDIVLFSHLASRRHGKLTSENGQLCVTDLGSTNGIIYHDNEVTEVKVDKDDFIRIDDGIETVSEGVLIIFATDEYSDTWESISTGEWGSEYDLNLISPGFDASIQRSGNLFYLNAQGSDLYINKKKVSGRVVLHEKDVIAFSNIRIVFTSTALYTNRLKTETVLDVPSPIQEKTLGNAIVEIEMENLQEDDHSDGAAPGLAQESPSVVNDWLSDNISESVHDEPLQQDAQPNTFSPNGYASTTSKIGGLRNFLASDVGYYVLSIIIAIIIWGIAVALWTSQGELALIVILACAIFGWQALNRIQPAMFIWMPWIGWIIYLCIKFFLSAMIGLFVAPFKIGKAIAGVISGSMM